MNRHPNIGTAGLDGNICVLIGIPVSLATAFNSDLSSRLSFSDRKISSHCSLITYLVKKMTKIILTSFISARWCMQKCKTVFLSCIPSLTMIMLSLRQPYLPSFFLQLQSPIWRLDNSPIKHDFTTVEHIKMWPSLTHGSPDRLVGSFINVLMFSSPYPVNNSVTLSLLPRQTLTRICYCLFQETSSHPDRGLWELSRQCKSFPRPQHVSCCRCF